MRDGVRFTIASNREHEPEEEMAIRGLDREDEPYADWSQVVVDPAHGIYLLDAEKRREFRKAVDAQLAGKDEHTMHEISRMEEQLLESDKFKAAVKMELEKEARQAIGRRRKLSFKYEFDKDNHLVTFWKGKPPVIQRPTAERKPETRERELVGGRR